MLGSVINHLQWVNERNIFLGSVLKIGFMSVLSQIYCYAMSYMNIAECYLYLV